VADLRAAGDELPKLFVEAAELFLNCEERLGVGDGRVDLQTVADDAFVGKQLSLFRRVIARDLRGIEAVERFAIALALAQDRLPTQPGLRAFEDEELEEDAVVVL